MKGGGQRIGRFERRPRNSSGRTEKEADWSSRRKKKG